MVFNFKYYMKNSNQLNEFTLGQLKEILKEYPYFQLARILYLKNLHLLQKDEFEAELKKTVVYIYNRPFLHDFLFEPTITSETSTVEPSIEGTNTEGEQKEKIEAIKEKEEVETVEIKEETEKQQPENNVSKEPEKKEEPQPTKKNFSANIKDNISGLLEAQLKEADKKTDELEISQLQMDIEKEYGKDLQKISKKQDVFVLIEDDQMIEKIENVAETDDKRRISNSVSYAKDLLEFDYVLRNTANYNFNKESSDNKNTPEKSFTEWLDSLNSIEQKPEEQKKSGLQETENSTVPDKSEIKNQIIDDFIKTNPAIRPEDKPFEFEDISTNSIKEDDNLVTDTLARIYYNQGRYDKALDAYQKLSLKYPEKNSYFATQIEKIKNKINDLK